MNSTIHNDKYNASGYIDPTAFMAVGKIEKENRRKIIKELKEYAMSKGYRIDSTIRLIEING